MEKLVAFLITMEKMCDWSNLVLIGIMLFFLYKTRPKWLESIRSVAMLMLAYTFCYGFINKLIEAKDFLLIVSMAFNFYFLVKKRQEENGGQEK
jgi:hypothetical protein